MVSSGEEYPGTHTPLVDPTTFAKVQAILEGRSDRRQRERVHRHYLKGTVYCGQCGSRLSYGRSRGRGGRVYEYFVCLGRHHKRTDCSLQSIPVHLVEELVEAEYSKIELTEQMVDELQEELNLGMRERTAHLEVEVTRQRRRITKLEDERRTLLQAHLHGAITVELLKEEQDRITRQLADAGAALASSEINWNAAEANLGTALSFVTD